MAQAVACYTAAVALQWLLQAVGVVLDVEPGHGALHGAEGFVFVQARAVVQAGVRLASGAAGVPLTDGVLAG